MYHLVDKLDWLNEEEDDEVVQVGLRQQYRGHRFWIWSGALWKQLRQV